MYIYEEMETELGQKVRIDADVNSTFRTSEDDNGEPINKKLKMDEESNGKTAKSQVDAEKYRLKNISLNFITLVLSSWFSPTQFWSIEPPVFLVF